MSSTDDPDHTAIDTRTAKGRNGYVELILRMMRVHRVSLRTLERRTGIGKSRLGLLLHSDPARRPSITFDELKALFAALDIDVFEAVICVEAFNDIDVLDAPRHRSVIALLRVVFRYLPVELLAALEEFDHIDGSDVRPEWAAGLQRAVVRRLVSEITRIAAERAIGWDREI